MVPIRKSEAHRFVQFQFKGIDDLTNKVIEGKLPSGLLVFLVWLSSYAWDNSGGTRNACTFSRSQLSEFFGVGNETVSKWLKTLKKLNLIEVTYIVLYPRENKRKRYKDYNQAYASIKGVNAQIEGLQVSVTTDWLRVKASKFTKGKVSESEDPEV
jgi:hypothetical protein